MSDVIKNCKICNKEFTTKNTKRGLKKQCCSPSCSCKLGQMNNIGETKCAICSKEITGSKSAITQGLPLYCQDCTEYRYKRKCEKCNEEFMSKKSDTRFCSRKCINEYNRDNTIELQCAHCKEMYIQSTFNVYSGKNNYCSKRCSDNHYSLNHKTRYGGTWTRRKREIKERDGNKCLMCGKTEELEQHHFIKLLTFDNPNDAHYDENVGTFCKTCHKEVEGKYKSLTDFNERYSPNSMET